MNFRVRCQYDQIYQASISNTSQREKHDAITAVPFVSEMTFRHIMSKLGDIGRIAVSHAFTWCILEVIAS